MSLLDSRFIFLNGFLRWLEPGANAELISSYHKLSQRRIARQAKTVNHFQGFGFGRPEDMTHHQPRPHRQNLSLQP